MEQIRTEQYANNVFRITKELTQAKWIEMQ